ncbi:hypothetical protein AJ79_00434 [Helicocarpus griseus UAMH5409]|uniref:Uncharacterized protein n=1 Tax=Helicocarpus griseus UAMH5409 TaxID=1447875 RepID=A0A2B7YBU0_9EURO|nr:hypothetical protein AJ79_00434 [Helicocarpus griseus UAMH5409]
MPVAGGYDERQKKFRQHWGFKYDCSICQNEEEVAKMGALEKRKRLIADAQKHAQSHATPKINGVERFVSMIAETYSQPAAEVPRLGLWDPLIFLAQVYLQQGQLVKAVESALKALESLGYVIDGGRLPFSPGTSLVVRKWGLMMD